MRALHRAAVTLVALAALCAVGGCAATPDQVKSVLNQKFQGQSIDELVTLLGPPAASFHMTDGTTAYSWRIGSVTNVDVGEYGGSAQTFSCEIRAIAYATGEIVSISTRDASLAVSNESLCAVRLGITR